MTEIQCLQIPSTQNHSCARYASCCPLCCMHLPRFVEDDKAAHITRQLHTPPLRNNRGVFKYGKLMMQVCGGDDRA